MKMIWKIFAGISVLCGLTTFLIGWASLALGRDIFGVATEFYFYDAIATVLFGIFFVLWGKSVEGGKK